MNQNNLPTRLRSALAERRPAAVRHLLGHHGLVAFAAALAVWSPRVVADVLSLLPQADRVAVLRHLPSALREDRICIRPLLHHTPVLADPLRLQAAASSSTHEIRSAA